MAETDIGLPDDVPGSTNKLRALTGLPSMPATVLAEVMAVQDDQGAIVSPADQAKQTTANTALGAPADAEATGNGSIIALLKRIRTLFTRGSTTASANVPTSTAVATLLASQPTRIKATVYNDSTLGMLKVKEGAGASATDFDYVLAAAGATSPGGLLICDDYTGILTGVLTAGTGTARVGETTP